jgi:hypothetical protein
MTKARTKAARRRRASLITLPGGDTVASRPTGRDRRHTNQAEPPADAVALASRAKFTGCSVEAARDVLAGEDMGRAILSMRPNAQDRRDLLGVWQGLCAAWHNFARRCLSLPTAAQGSAMPMLPEPMQTDQSLRVDLRSPDERDEAARRVWYAWLAELMKLPPDQRHALRGHLQDYGAPVWDADAKQPTRAGALAVKALASLHDGRTR